MAYTPLIDADLAAGKPARWDSFAKRIHDNFEDHEDRIVAEEAATTALDTRIDSLELGTTTLTLTTTGDIDALALGGATMVRMNNATLATIRGIVAPTAGQPKHVMIVSIGAGQVNLAHQHITPTTTNRLINFVTVGDTPLAAGSGTAVFRYDDTTQRWRLIQHEQGSSITPTYNAADFTASAGTWGVDAAEVRNYSFHLAGKMMTMTFDLRTTDVSATPQQLRMAIPLSMVVAKAFNIPGMKHEDAGGASTIGLAVVAAGIAYVALEKLTGAAWSTTAVDNTFVAGQITFEVQ